MKILTLCSLLIITVPLFAEEPVTDSASVRFGLFAEFDGSIDDVLGIRIQLGKDNTFLAQGAYSSSFFNNEERSNGGTRDGTYHKTFVLFGYERLLTSYKDADVQFYSSLEYSWYRSKQTEELYHYDPVTNNRVIDGLAGTESKNTSYGVNAGIGIEYHVSEQLSVELMKRIHFIISETYQTYTKNPPGRSTTTGYGVDDVFLNIIFYF